MKNLLKLATVICLIIATSACSSDNDPVDDDFFVGTYKGAISYTNSDGDKESHDDGKVTVVKVASKTKYNFEFSNGIPSLNGVEFEEDGDDRLINVDFEDGVQYIKISASSLKMLYSKDGSVWTANLER